MGRVGCPETSVDNYQYTLCNAPEERRFEVVYFEGGAKCLPEFD